MAKLRIPERSLPGIKYISLLNESEINLLYEVLRKLPKGVSFSGFFKILSDEIKIDNISDISHSVFSLGSLLSNTDVSIEKLSADIVEAYEEQQDEDELIKLNKDLLEERIKFIFLNSSSIKLRFEAFDIITNSNKAVVQRTEVSADVRLVFEDDYKIRHGVIIHTLKIIFNSLEEQDQVQQFILDTDDLQQLKGQIEAALLREENIKNNNQGVINFIEVTE